MTRVIDGYCRILEVAIAVLLAIMALLVFANVVLRYGFNTGITVSEEVSRWMFVWLTFLGGVVALKEHAHLGTDALVAKLGPGGKRACLVAGQLLMLYVTWLLLKGSYEQARINWDVQAPVTGASVAIFYGAGIAFAISAGMLLIVELVRAVTGRLSESQMVMVRESTQQTDSEEFDAAPTQVRHQAATGAHASEARP